MAIIAWAICMASTTLTTWPFARTPAAAAIAIDIDVDSEIDRARPSNAAMALVPAAARRRVSEACDTLGGRWAAYELVLCRLTADDRLCAALACRAFCSR